MLIKTSSGNIIINKRSPYGKFVIGYTSTGKFSGIQTLKAAWLSAHSLKNKYPSLSWADTGKLAASYF